MQNCTASEDVVHSWVGEFHCVRFTWYWSSCYVCLLPNVADMSPDHVANVR